MGATMAGEAVPVLEAGSRPEAALGISPRGIFRPSGVWVNIWSEGIRSTNRPMIGPAGGRRDRSEMFFSLNCFVKFSRTQLSPSISSGPTKQPEDSPTSGPVTKPPSSQSV